MVDIKKITGHGQDSMLFYCEKCGNTVSIDTFDLLNAEETVFCPVCGASGKYLNHKLHLDE